MTIDMTLPKLPHEMTCHHCGLTHKTTCPRIKAIEYHQDGTVKRIEFHGPLGFSTTGYSVVAAPGPEN